MLSNVLLAVDVGSSLDQSVWIFLLEGDKLDILMFLAEQRRYVEGGRREVGLS